MNKKILYRTLDGNVSIVHLCDPARQADEPDDVFIARIQARHVPLDAVDIKIIEEIDLPSDRTFRNAWTYDGQRVCVDMPKARTLHLDRIRQARKPVLDQLDKDWMRAMGQRKQAEADTIEAQRQVLRNLPQTLDLTQATTAEELKAIWPAELPRTGA